MLAFPSKLLQAIGKKTGVGLAALCLAAAGLFVVSCQTSEVEPEFFLGLQSADSLANYDKVVLIVRDSAGKVLDTAFQGKVTSASDLEKLPVPHYKSGTMTIEVLAFRDGTMVLQQIFTYDPETKTPSDNVFVRAPQTRITFPDTSLTVVVGEEEAFPKATIFPSSLIDASLEWSVSDTLKVALVEHGLVPLSPGKADLVARLASDTGKMARIALTIVASDSGDIDTSRIRSMTLVPDTAKVLLGLKSYPFSLVFDPPEANPIVRFESLDPTLATVTSAGELTGIKAGVSRIRVYTLGLQNQGNLSDTGWVVIADPSDADTTTLTDWFELYLGGPSDTLRLAIPTNYAKGDLAWNDEELPFIRLETPAEAAAGLVVLHPLSLGKGLLALSYAKDAKLQVRIPVRVRHADPTRVRIDSDNLILFMGAEPETLHASLTPTYAMATPIWSSRDANIARVDSLGRIFPESVGVTTVRIATGITGVTDSIRVEVRRDLPQLKVQADSDTVSIRDSATFTVTASQHHGAFTYFAWKTDGEWVEIPGAPWTDSTQVFPALKRAFLDEGQVVTGFRIRDDEGNDTSVQVTVTVLLNPPTADAGKDTTVVAGSLVRLRASGNDPNGSIVKREVLIGNGPRTTLSGTDTTFNAPGSAQVLTCIVRVTDDDNLWDEDTMRVSVVLDSNANLSDLKLSAGTLEPAFRSDVTNYIATLGFSDSSVTATPTYASPTKVAINGVNAPANQPSREFKPMVGPNPDMIKVVVTAANLTQKTYYISLNRDPNSESRLSQLAVSGLGKTFVFDSTKLSYVDTVPRANATLQVTPTSRDANATVKVAGAIVARGSASSSLPLSVGTNTIPVEVTAQDGTTKTTYTLTVERRTKLVMEHAIGGSPIPYDSLEVAIGGSAALRPPTLTGFRFRAWAITKGTGTLANAELSTSQVTARSDSMRLWAQMDTSAYDLNVTKSGSGTVMPSGTVNAVRHFVRTNLLATPDVGHHFVDWTGPTTAAFGDPASASTWVTLTGNATVQARFAIDRFSVTATAANGTIARTPDSGVVDYGTVVTLVAKPNPGYLFDGWTGDTTATKDTLVMTVKKSRNLTAQFKPKQYKLIIQDNGLGQFGCTSAPMGEQTVSHGVPFQIQTAESCFLNWGGALIIWYGFSTWQVVSGEAVFENQGSSATTVQLLNGDAVIMPVHNQL